MSKNTLVLAALSALAGAAVAKETGQPKQDRTGHGHIAGIPYDFRRPSAARARKEFWDPGNDSLLTPHSFGIGYGVNLARVARPAREALASVRARLHRADRDPGER